MGMVKIVKIVQTMPRKQQDTDSINNYPNHALCNWYF